MTQTKCMYQTTRHGLKGTFKC